MAKQWTAKQQEVREAEKKRVSSIMSGGGRRLPPPSEEEVRRAIAEFEARGGRVQRVDTAVAGGSIVVSQGADPHG